MNRDDVVKLEVWITLPEAMAILGISKNGLHKMIWDQDLFHLDEIRYIGDKRAFLLNEVAVYKLRDVRLQSLAIREARRNMDLKISELRSVVS